MGSTSDNKVSAVACSSETCIFNPLGDVGLRTGPTGGLSADGNISTQRRKKEKKNTFFAKIGEVTDKSIAVPFFQTRCIWTGSEWLDVFLVLDRLSCSG